MAVVVVMIRFFVCPMAMKRSCLIPRPPPFLFRTADADGAGQAGDSGEDADDKEWRAALMADVERYQKSIADSFNTQV